MKFSFLTWMCFAAVTCFASAEAPSGSCNSTEARDRAEHLTRRYDSFFQYRDELERRRERIEQASAAVKKEGAVRADRLERARREVVRVVKDRQKEERLRRVAEAEQKERSKRLELARLCEVESRNAAQRLLKKGRQIPEMKEFDLDLY
jgi:hypothetical protein